MRCIALVCLTVYLVVTGTAEAAGIASVDMRCEYKTAPLGIDETIPRLSWQLEAPDEAGRGLVQQAYQVQVAASEAALAAGEAGLWDSGKVESAQTHLVPYAGVPLESRQRCYWRVRVWDGGGNASPWSAPAFWSMGLLDDEDWQATWIGLEGEDETLPAVEGAWVWLDEGDPRHAAAPGYAHFRRVFTLPDAEVVSAQLVGTADNAATFMLNGATVLATKSYHHADKKEVARHLRRNAENVLAVVARNDGEDVNPAGVLAALTVQFADGGEMRIASDAEWVASKEAAAGWEESPFNDDAWKPVQVLGDNGVEPWGTTTYAPERRLAARYVRKEFGLDKEVARATAYVCGLGFHELYLNGERVGAAELAPALTDYRDRAFYSTYDVTDLVARGANAAGAALGNGRYYAPRYGNPFPTLSFGFPKLLVQLDVTYADGETARIVTDTSWKVTADGPIRNNNVYDGEEYDARMELGAWTSPGYDDRVWQQAEAVPPLEGALEAHHIEPIRVTRRLKPQRRTEPEPGVFILDMGQNMVGWMRFTVDAPEGTTITLRHAEVLDDEGNLDVRNMRSARVTTSYTCKGGGPETYTPSFSYYGFRFVEVTGWPGTPPLDAFTGEVLHTDVEPVGDFHCSNGLINRIHENIQWGVRGNLRSIPTDCPQRDERHGWLGDIANESKAQSYEFLMANFYTKWLDDIRLAQNAEGSIPDVAPPFWEMYNDNVTWPGTYVILPSWFYAVYADQCLIERHYPHMKQWVQHMRGYIDDEGLMPRDTYGDWCVPPEDPELIHTKDPARKAEGELLGTTYFYKIQLLMASYARLLGKPEDAAEFDTWAEEMKAAFNREFLDTETATYGKGTQTGQVLPLYFGMVPEEHHGAVFDRLAEMIEANGGHLATGLIGCQWLMRTLSDNGRPDLAYTIATKTDYPSWGYMVKQGATTIWELWNGDTADPAMNSHNHVMLTGDLCIWFYEYLAGIRPAAPGFAEIEIKPYVLGDLTEVQAHTGTTRGRVASHWTRDGDTLTLDVAIPPNTAARIGVPTLGAEAVTIREGDVVCWDEGAFESGVDGLSGAMQEDGWVVFEAGSGNYRFNMNSAS
ncbi:MAG: family 78 glycoside hydrolase catalytic domain [Candidatus Hydrogenedentota bacterium]